MAGNPFLGWKRPEDADAADALAGLFGAGGGAAPLVQPPPGQAPASPSGMWDAVKQRQANAALQAMTDAGRGIAPGGTKPVAYTAPAPPAGGAPAAPPQQYQMQAVGTNTSQSTRTIVPEALKAKLSGATEAQKQALGEIATVEGNAAGEQAATQKDTRKALDALRADTAAKEAATREDIAAKMADVDRLRSEYSSMKPDEHRWWGSRSAGQKVMGALGIMLGGLNEGLSGGKLQNRALQMIDKAIDTDIKMQLAEVHKKGTEIEMGRNAVADMYRQLGDLRSAESAVRVGKLEDLKLALGQIGSTAKSESAGARTKLVGAQLDEKLAKERIDLEKRVVTASSTRTKFAAMPVAGAAPAGKVLPEKDREEVKKADDTLADFERVKDLYQKALAEGAGKWNPFNPAVVAYNNALIDARQKLRNARSGSAFGKMEAKEYEAIMPGLLGPGRVETLTSALKAGSAAGVAKLDTLIGTLRASRNKYVDVLGRSGYDTRPYQPQQPQQQQQGAAPQTFGAKPTFGGK